MENKANSEPMVRVIELLVKARNFNRGYLVSQLAQARLALDGALSYLSEPEHSTVHEMYVMLSQLEEKYGDDRKEYNVVQEGLSDVCPHCKTPAPVYR